MAHFAEIDENNTVLRVLVVDDLYEEDGQTFLSETCGLGGTWLKTSFNTVGGTHLFGGTPYRKNFAGIGMVYDQENDAFRGPQPFESWTLNEDTFLWEPPVERPLEGNFIWNEETTSWDEVTE
jgi:hypothetical protein